MSSNANTSPRPQTKRRRDVPLPVLIIPGFMSSGLEVLESSSRSWVGKRVWINLTSLGFGSIHGGGALDLNERKRESGDGSGYSEEAHQEYQRQLDCKSKWLQHLSLSNDMMNERPGIKVRPIKGLAGVDYLTPGALTNLVSYVFGPVIDALRNAGYTDDNLSAAPYDWRLPPSKLESRDQYFTQTKALVEDMYKRNGDTPVVLLCHSLGCKTGHYFLNFVKYHAEGGTKWLEKHIHTYMPVGGPHLGAPKAIRGLVDGDKMGLDTFLSDEEGLVLGRSLGSGPWLVPRQLPTAELAPNVFIRREGILEVTVPPIDCTSLLRARSENPPKLRLAVIFGKEILMTDFQSPTARGRREKIQYNFPETFTFASPLHIPKGKSSELNIQMVLQERGIKAAKKSKQEEEGLWKSPICCPLRFAVCILCCPIKYVLCLPCTLVGCVTCMTLKITRDVSLAAADVTAAAMGAGTNVALSRTFTFPKALAEGNDAEVRVKMLHVRDEEPKLFATQRTAGITARLRWTPPPNPPEENSRRMTPVAITAPSGLEKTGASFPTLKVRHHKKKHVRYEASDGYELLQNEGLERTLNLIHDCYETDELGPRTRSAEDAPPVLRVKAIYGINLPTETGAIYRRKSMLVQPNNHRIEKLHRVDSSARASYAEKKMPGYNVQGGIILETKNTLQSVARPAFGQNDKTKPEVVQRSGDGTVPYWSMQHCKTWQGPSCDVDVVEIDRAPHREILADGRFHKVLVDYVTHTDGGSDT